MSFYYTIIACQFHCINIRNFITLNVWGKYKRSIFVIVTVLFTKPSSSILPAVGMTSETVPAAGPIHGLQCYSQSHWFLSYWLFPKLLARTPPRGHSCRWLPWTANGRFSVPQELYQSKSWNFREL